jgi:AbiJ N-terminal domain 4
MGLKPSKNSLQTDSVDQALRNSLWNALDLTLWQRINTDYYDPKNNSAEFDQLFAEYWLFLFKAPVYDRPKQFAHVLENLRLRFFSCEWHEVYDFIEFSLKNCPEEFRDSLKWWCNHFLEIENSAYRIVNNEFVEVTSDAELTEIEKTLQNPLGPIREHLQTAISHLSSRNNPDYRNSVKESISAVEALARAVSDKPKATLGQLIKTLESHAGLHQR